MHLARITVMRSTKRSPAAKLWNSVSSSNSFQRNRRTRFPVTVRLSLAEVRHLSRWPFLHGEHGEDRRQAARMTRRRPADLTAHAAEQIVGENSAGGGAAPGRK
jgi:hypothetical protein